MVSFGGWRVKIILERASDIRSFTSSLSQGKFIHERREEARASMSAYYILDWEVWV